MNRSPLEAYDALMRFARDRGEWPLRLAMHAAVPRSFRPRFLHLAKLNFLPEAAADPSVESDVLLAPFCEEIGAGYYQFDPQVRALLVDNLQSTYADEGPRRLYSVAALLLAYLDEQERSIDSTLDRLSQSYVDVERWVALAVLDPDIAAQQLAAALSAGMRGPAAARLQVGGLVSVLAEPLLRYPALADYVSGVQALERGEVERARELMSGLGEGELQVGTVKLRPARQVLSDWGVQPGEATAGAAFMPCVVAHDGGFEVSRLSGLLVADLRRAGPLVRVNQVAVAEGEALVLIGAAATGPNGAMLAELVEAAASRGRPIITVSLDRSWGVSFKGTFSARANIDFSSWRSEDSWAYSEGLAKLLDALRPEPAAAKRPRRIFVYFSNTQWRLEGRLKSRLLAMGYDPWSFGPSPGMPSAQLPEVDQQLREADAIVIVWCADLEKRDFPALWTAHQPRAILRADRAEVPVSLGGMIFDATGAEDRAIEETIEWLGRVPAAEPEPCDVYIGFDPYNNLDGWVSAWRRDFEDRVTQITGSRITVWMGSEVADLARLNRARVVVAILSPSYLASHRGSEELEAAPPDRTFVIDRERLERKRVPKKLQAMQRFEFTGVEPGSELYGSLLSSVAAAAARILAPPPAVYVYATADLLDHRASLIQELRNHGYDQPRQPTEAVFDVYLMGDARWEGHDIRASRWGAIWIAPGATPELPDLRGTATEVIEGDFATVKARVLETLSKPPPEPERFVFLSYSSVDTAAGRLMRETLERAGLAVQSSERAGPDVLGAIDRCAVFIAVISRSATSAQPRFVFKEWQTAIERSRRIASDVPFLIPVAIDDTPHDIPMVPDSLRDLMWQRAEGGRLSPSFVEMLAGRLGRPMPAREVAWSRERFEGDLRTVNELAGKGQSEHALDAAHTLLEHIQTAGYSEAGHDEAVVRLARAGLLQQTGAIENALGDVRQALAEFRKSGDTHMAAVALSKEGECLLAMARYDEAVRSFEESIRLSEQLRELGGPAQGRYRLATVWMAQGRFAQALEVATHALELFRRQGDLPSIANGLSLTGTIYESLKRYEDAIKAYRESIDISAKTGDLTAQATGAERLGSLYALLRNPRDAERSYRQAGSLFASSGDPMRQSKVLSSLAELLFRQRRFDEARVELGQVLYLQAPLGHAAEPWRAYRLLSEVEKAAGDHGAGFRALAQAVTLYRDYRKEGGTPQPDFENLEPPAGASAMA